MAIDDANALRVRLHLTIDRATNETRWTLEPLLTDPEELALVGRALGVILDASARAAAESARAANAARRPN